MRKLCPRDIEEKFFRSFSTEIFSSAQVKKKIYKYCINEYFYCEFVRKIIIFLVKY